MDRPRHLRAHPAIRKEQAKARVLGREKDPDHRADHDLPPLQDHRRRHLILFAFAVANPDILLEIALNSPGKGPTQDPFLEKV
jgi:hypothetical protein